MSLNHLFRRRRPSRLGCGAEHAKAEVGPNEKVQGTENGQKEGNNRYLADVQPQKVRLVGAPLRRGALHNAFVSSRKFIDDATHRRCLYDGSLDGVAFFQGIDPSRNEADVPKHRDTKSIVLVEQ